MVRSCQSGGALWATVVVLLGLAAALSAGEEQAAAPSDSFDNEVAAVRMLLEQGRCDPAAEALERLSERRADAGVFQLLAEAYHCLGRDEEALFLCERAQRIEERAATFRLQGVILLEQARPAGASEALRRAAELGDQSAEMHVAAAGAAYQLGNLFGKVTDAPDVEGGVGTITVSGVVVRAAVEGESPAQVAELDSAYGHLRQALAAGGGDSGLRRLEGRIWLDGGYYRNAVEVLRELADDLPKEEQAAFHYDYARALYGADDVEGFLVHLRKAAQLDSAKYEEELNAAYGKAARRFAQRGNTERYIAMMEMAAAADAKNAELHYQLGNAYWEAGRLDEAVRRWRITLELRPDHPDRERMLRHIASRAVAPGSG